MDVRVGLQRKLSTENLMLLNCGIGEDSWESLKQTNKQKPNQSILKEINPEYSLEGLMMKCQYFGHLMQRVNTLENILTLGKTEGRRRRWQRMRWLDSITDSVDMNLCKFQEMVKDREAWHVIVHGVAKSQTWLNNWATKTMSNYMPIKWTMCKKWTNSYKNITFQNWTRKK